MSGFDRIKKPGERLATRSATREPDSERADTAGRAALFSAADTARPPTPAASSGPASASASSLAERGRRLLLDDAGEPGQPGPVDEGATAEPLLEGGPRRRPDVSLGGPDVHAPAARDARGAGDVAGAAGAGAAGGVGDAADGEVARSILTVECGHCGDVCPMPLAGAISRALPLAVVVPWRSHPVFAICPCGQRRAWLKPKVGLPRP